MHREAINWLTPPGDTSAAACIRVRVAHDDAIVQAGLAALLRGCPGMAVDVAGEHTTHGATPDVLVTGFRQGLACARLAKQGGAGARVLIVSRHELEWDIHTAMTAGVQGYLLQSASAEQLTAAVRTLSRGLRYISPELSSRVADSVSRVGLTNRESDVLQLLAQGCCNKSIARELGIGLGTVKTHIKGVFYKLGATARTQAVVLATRRGLVGAMELRRPASDMGPRANPKFNKISNSRGTQLKSVT